VEDERTLMSKSIKTLLPCHMAEMVLSVAHEPLPVKVFREYGSCVLHLDLANYTSLTRSMGSREVALLMHDIFCEFDTCLANLGAASGIFKVDTIGDAYQVSVSGLWD
jgi:class 3 adenylate cyclase